jgi:two-component system response regulator AtoC
MAPVREAILVVDEEPEVRRYLKMALGCLPYQVQTAENVWEAVDRLKGQPSDEFALILLNIDSAQSDAIDALRDIREVNPSLPIIVLSGTPAPGMIVSAMKNGATDFLATPLADEDLTKAISRVLKGKINPNPVRARSAVPCGQAFIGKSAGMAAIGAIIGQVGWSEAPILIQGETGSGKEVIAREVHANSRRAKKSFFKLNCAALPSELVESELFGYEKGAFTGAFQRKPGIFEAANGGTILLDEIGDMDVRLQAKLLQVLQDHEFQRIGGKETIKVDVRVIAATHRDLEAHIEEGKFREDLYYRLNVVNLVVPPLRERREDIAGLTDFLLSKHLKPGDPTPSITPELRTAMANWSWPGNVRELENFVRKLLIFQDSAIMLADLADRTRRRERATAVPIGVPVSHRLLEAVPDPSAAQPIPVLEQVTVANRRAEAEAILAALNTTRWNRKHAAVLLNVDYKALLYKMKKLNLDRNRPADEEVDLAAETETTPPVARTAAMAC